MLRQPLCNPVYTRAQGINTWAENSKFKRILYQSIEVMSSESAAAASDVEPSENDIILGRVATVFHHPGNRRYREIIALNLRLYTEATNRLDKMLLIRQITDQILDGGKVKFLRKDHKSGRWTELPLRLAQDKISHALRDGVNKSIFTPLMLEAESSKQKSDKTLAATSASAPSASNLPTNRRELSFASTLRTTVNTGVPSALQMRTNPAASTINLNSQRFNPVVSLDRRTMATASSRAALAEMNFLSGLSQPQPIVMPYLQNLPRTNLAALGRPHIHNRELSLLMTAPAQQNFTRAMVDLSLTRPLPAAVGHANTRLPFLPRPQRLIRPSVNMDFMARMERDRLIANHLAQSAAQSQLLQDMHQHRQEATAKVFLNQIVQRYSQSSGLSDTSTGAQGVAKKSRLSDGSASTKDAG